MSILRNSPLTSVYSLDPPSRSAWFLTLADHPLGFRVTSCFLTFSSLASHRDATAHGAAKSEMILQFRERVLTDSRCLVEPLIPHRHLLSREYSGLRKAQLHRYASPVRHHRFRRPLHRQIRGSKKCSVRQIGEEEIPAR